MNKWKVIVPVSLASAAAAALLLRRGRKTETPKAEKAASAKAPAKAAAPAKALAQGTYSFVSGFAEPATIELSLNYDADKMSFDVVGEEYLFYSSDSHVAIMQGEDFSLQIEYAALFSGEDFSAMCAAAKEKYNSPADFANGIRYISGDALCICLPVDESSYILINVLKAKDNDTELAELCSDPELSAILSSIEIKRSV